MYFVKVKAIQHIPPPRINSQVRFCSSLEGSSKISGPTYLKVFGDGVVGSVGGQQDPIGFADQPMSFFDFPCVPVNDTCSHDGHAQLGVVGVVQLPVCLNNS